MRCALDSKRVIRRDSTAQAAKTLERTTTTCESWAAAMIRMSRKPTHKSLNHGIYAPETNANVNEHDGYGMATLRDASDGFLPEGKADLYGGIYFV